jgi:hypothetical protein
LKKNWLDALAESGKKHQKEKLPPKQKPQVHQVIVTTRHPNPDVGDPGAIRTGHWFLENSHVYLSSADGTPLTDSSGVPLSIELQDGVNPASLACVLLRERVRGTSQNGFEKGPLRYGPLGIH